MKNKKITALLLSAALGLCAIGCSDINAEDTDPSKGGSYSSDESEKGTGAAIEFDNVRNTPYDEAEAINAYLDYSFDLYGKTVAKGNNNENIMISPASAFIALEMTAAGARGTTLTEMSGLLKSLGSEDPMAVQHFAIDYQDRLNNAKGVKLRSADSIWLNSNILKGNINADYTDYADGSYHAEIKESAFSTDTVKEINDWVDDNTDHMIPNIIQDLDPLTAAVLVNAIAFDGEWAVQYTDDQVHENDFTNADGRSEDALYLAETGSVYFESDKATGFMKPYDGGEYAFLAILPKERINANDFMADFTAEDYRDFYNSKSEEWDVRTIIPEFTYDYEYLMNDTLKEMGINAAFSSEAADFSNIAELGEDTLYISRVIHKTHIELDQSGTKAAAATVVDMRVNSAIAPNEYKEVYLDRPFAYAIVDTDNGVPVFIGTVNSVDGMAEQLAGNSSDGGEEDALPVDDDTEEPEATPEPVADFEPADSRFAFETKDIYGNKVNDDIFSQYDVTVVNVWGTFCYYCIVEMPELQEWYESMPSSVNIIGIVCDIQNENDSYYINEAQSIVKDTGVTYTNLIPKDGLSKLMNEVSAVPTTYFIDREGNVVGSTVYGADMDAYKREVEKLLK